jgi:hypothetical protein
MRVATIQLGVAVLVRIAMLAVLWVSAPEGVFKAACRVGSSLQPPSGALRPGVFHLSAVYPCPFV